MRSLCSYHWLKGVTGIFLSTLLVAFHILFLTPTKGYCQNYSAIKVRPMDVGVFWNLKTQQFTARGLNASGAWVDITSEVSWKSSDPEIVTIDENGLATAVRSWGTVDITAIYPKIPTKPLPPKMAVFSILLYQTYTVTPSAGSGGSITPANPLEVKKNHTTQFTLTTDPHNRIKTVTSTPCGGTLNAQEFTTGPVLDDCAVSATFLEQYTLTAAKVGSGYGTITSNIGNINCGTGSDCIYDYDPNTYVKLTAQADTGHAFTSWMGSANCTDLGPSSTSDCIVKVYTSKTVTATFTITSHLLTIEKPDATSIAGGTVTSGNIGSFVIDCTDDTTDDCSELFNYNTPVTLKVTENTGYKFDGWGGQSAAAGNCEGTNAECTITMKQTETLTATFSEIVQ